MKKKIIVLLKLTVPYVLIILLPMISVFSLGIWMVNDYHEKIIKEHQRKTSLAFERYIQRIQSIENLAYMISNSDVLVKHMISGKNKADHTVIEHMELLAMLKNSYINNDIEEIYFYEKNTNDIITSNIVMSKAEDYFNLVYKPEETTPSECIEQMNQELRGYQYEAVKDIIIRGTKKQIMEYRISLPLNALPNAVSGRLVMAMKAESIFGDLYDVSGSDCEFYVSDSKGEVVYGSGTQYAQLLSLAPDTSLQSVEWNGENVFHMVFQSEDSKWTVNMFCTEAFLMGEQEKLGLPVLLLIVMPNVVGVLLCIYFTFKNHRDIKGIMTLFGEQSEETTWDKDESLDVGYGAIKKSVEKLISENTGYKERIRGYEISRKQEMLYRLIHKDYEDYGELTRSFPEDSLSVATGKCCLLCIRYMGAYYRTLVSEQMTSKELVKEILNNLLEQNFEIFDSTARETVCILTVEEEESAELVLQDIVSRLKVEIEYSFGVRVEIVAGGVVDSLSQIHESYSQAKEVLRYIENSGADVSLYTDFVKLKELYYYPKDIDEKIYNYIVSGKSKEAKEIVRTIYEANFVNHANNCTTEREEVIKNKLKEVVASFEEKHDISLKLILEQLSSVGEISDYFDMIYDCVDKLAEAIMNRKEVRQNQSAMKIIEYVNENYCNSILSLKQISQEFGLNETYVSTLFRKAYGEKFSVVIEELRIKKACELILEDDKKISDIAEMVGYSSDIVFRRAFKKITGVAPGEYKKQVM